MNFFSLVRYQNPLFSFQYICLRVFTSCFLSASAAHSTNSFSKIPQVRIRFYKFGSGSHCSIAHQQFHYSKKLLDYLQFSFCFCLVGLKIFSQNLIESVVLCASKLFEITPSYYCVILHALTDNCMVLTVSFDYE